MAFPVGVQLSVELTKIVPVRQIVTTTFQAAIDLARSLRNAGSDLLVEEDLATIFGRGKVTEKLEIMFKESVNISSIESLNSDGGIALVSGPAATVQRALKDRYYLATIIQLSFLAWIHERTNLATTLVDCMNKRFQLGVPGAGGTASYEGVLGTLNTCVSETSKFPWETFLRTVEDRLWHADPRFTQLLQESGSALQFIPPNVLLGAMDYLFLVQSLPEDRVVMVESPNGLIPIVVWAHYILGLTVMVSTSRTEIVFGQAKSAQVIIRWDEKWNPLPHKHQPPTIYLFDGNQNVVLKSDPEYNSMIQMQSQERIRLKGYGTTVLRRDLNRNTWTPHNDPKYQEFAQIATALAICMSKKLRRLPFFSQDEGGNDLEVPAQCYSNIEQWRLYDSAELLFSGIQLDNRIIKSYVPRIIGVNVEDIELPPSIPKKQASSENICSLAILILTFANVIDLNGCSNIPLVYYPIYFLERTDTWARSLRKWNGRSPIDIESNAWFYGIIRLLLGDAAMEHHQFLRTSLVSDYGWSLFLSTFGESDPANVHCELLHLKEGVPVNTRTGERKYRIEDAPTVRGQIRRPFIVENGGNYVARCISPVTKREDMYSSREQEFRQVIRFQVDETGTKLRPQEEAQFSIFASYRSLHDSLWHIVPTVPCDHGVNAPDQGTLALGVATVRGFFWDAGEEDAQNYRICICLVKGDRHARWAMLTGISPDSGFMRHLRRVLVRREDCCHHCAVDYAGSLPGKWLVIL